MIKFYQAIADAMILSAVSVGIEVTTNLTVRHSSFESDDIELIVMFPNNSYTVELISDRVKITYTRIKRDALDVVISVVTKCVDYCLSDPDIFNIVFKYMKENDYA